MQFLLKLYLINNPMIIRSVIMEPALRKKRKPRKIYPTPTKNRYFYNVARGFREVLRKFEKRSNFDEPTLFVLKSRITVLIERLIQSDFQLDKGILMNEMLKYEADLAISIWMLRHTGFDQAILLPESS